MEREMNWPIGEVRRWTDAELNDLQHRLNAEARINWLCKAASNAIGSVRFDKVDLRARLDAAEQELARLRHHTGCGCAICENNRQMARLAGYL